jgi:predicted O-methyltransferase YrrM
MAARDTGRPLEALGERVFRLLGQGRRADLLRVRQLEGFLTRKKAALLYDAVLGLEGPGAVAEVGSWKGKSTVTLALALRRSGRRGPVYAIDHFQGSEEHKDVLGPGGSTWDEFQRTVSGAGVADLVEPLRMDSLGGARWLFARGLRLRFLFLDGAHDEASVRADLEAFLPLLLPGALVALDDARPDGPFPGVHRAYEALLEPRSREVAWGGPVLLVRLVA